MLSRLYGGSEKGIPTTPLVGSKDVGAADPVMWLNAEDRSALSDLYGYAQETGADLHYVDDIAFQLAYYRQTAGTVVSNWTTNPMYDTEGHRLTSSFSDKDVASAKVIQTNSNNTKLDKGFLNYILDQGYGQNHIMNFQFWKNSLLVARPVTIRTLTRRNLEHMSSHRDRLSPHPKMSNSITRNRTLYASMAYSPLPQKVKKRFYTGEWSADTATENRFRPGEKRTPCSQYRKTVFRKNDTCDADRHSYQTELGTSP